MSPSFDGDFCEKRRRPCGRLLLRGYYASARATILSWNHVVEGLFEPSPTTIPVLQLAELTLYRDTSRECEGDMITLFLSVQQPRRAIPRHALVELEKAVSSKPDFGEAYYDWGNLLLQMGEADKAIPKLEYVLKINPNDAYAHYTLGIGVICYYKWVKQTKQSQNSNMF